MTCGKQLGISCFIFSKMKAEAGLPPTVILSPLLCFDLAFSCSDFTLPHCFLSLLQFHIPTFSFLFFFNKNYGIFFLRMASHSRSESCRKEDWPVVFTYSLNYKAAGHHFYSFKGKKIAGISADLLSVVKTDPGDSRSHWKWRIPTMTLTTATSWPFLDTDKSKCKNGENKAWLSLLAVFFHELAAWCFFFNLHQALYSHHLSLGWYYNYMIKGCETSHKNKPSKWHDCST